ncbi:MAG: dienelactone hydrolase family protein [Aquihabitans sp.]
MPAIELTAEDGHVLTAHRSDPDGAPIGAVVVVQEIFGVNDHIRSVVDRFAEDGFVAVAPALFDRVERGAELAYDTEGSEAGKELAWNLPIDHPLLDLTATADVLATEVGGAANVATVGFCYGGMLSAAMASRRARHLGAAVAYYPSMAAQLLVKDQPHIPLLVHLGDLDSRVTPADGAALAARWPEGEFLGYPAGLGFNCDERADHEPEASALAWERTVSFLRANLQGGE